MGRNFFAEPALREQQCRREAPDTASVICFDIRAAMRLFRNHASNSSSRAFGWLSEVHISTTFNAIRGKEGGAVI